MSEPNVPIPEDSVSSDMPDTSDQAVGRRIREAREGRGFTQQALSTRSKWVDPEGKGVSRTTLVAYESGTSRPGTREIRILCESLFVTPNNLIFGRENPFEASHPAREALKVGRGDIGEVAQLAFALTALKGHERDALLTMALSLAGRQLGDARLSGLRSLATLGFSELLTEEWARQSPESFTDGKLIVPLEQLAEQLSMGAFSNIGNKLRFNEETDEIEGEWLYPDPKAGAPD